ncbi:hypothetical protein CL654_03010 [bacterium]|nr:hypothetical protein [bacterium]|tara:strand:+ start:4536 stop:5171 length:636 start_codon:yes stop_codon:yes gene_type:complete
MNKIITTLVIIIILVIGGYFVYQNQEEAPNSEIDTEQTQENGSEKEISSGAEDMNIYRTSQYDFELRYPKELNVGEDKDEGLLGKQLGVAFYSTDSSDPEIQFVVYDKVGGGKRLFGPSASESGETYESASSKIKEVATSANIKYENVEVNGLKGFRLDTFGEGTHEDIFLFGKDYTYSIVVRKSSGIRSSSLFETSNYTGSPNNLSEIFN